MPDTSSPKQHTGLSQEQPLRVVLAKPGLDGHNVGIKVIARAFRDAGFDVIYLGLRVPIEHIVQTALQEDAHLIGISNLSGALSGIVEQLQQRMAELDLQIPIVVGGTLVPEERLRLRELGVQGVYGPGTSFEEAMRDAREVALNYARIR